MESKIEDSRKILTSLLIGMDAFPSSPVSVKNFSGQVREGVKIIPMEYPSRPYPFYESRGGQSRLSFKTETIKAVILKPGRPNGKAVIALHQHNLEFELGKSEVAGLKTGKSPGQMYGLELAKKGYTVLSFDFLPFESRMISHEEFGGYGGERLAKQSYSQSGVELMGIHILDTMRAVDILQNEGFRDIGVIGHSLGGMVSVFSMACDPRIKAGASNCGIGTMDSVNRNQIIHNWAWTVHNMKSFGEMSRLFELIAERSFLVSAAKNDKYFPLEGVRNCVNWGRAFYKNKENLQLYEFQGSHDFPQEARENAYRFLDKNL